MPANTSLSLTSLDFDTIKNDLKTFLQSQDKFKDYDFEGSNMSMILDVLAYNTYKKSFYLNMVGSEMFLDSAQLKQSVTSRAKELNYLPRSFKSSSANVDITVTTANSSIASVVIPKGTSFSGKIGSNSYSFSTDQSITMSPGS